jgi:signal transduction histidine kinase
VALVDEVAVIAAPVALLAVTISTIALIAGWNRRSELLSRQARSSGQSARRAGSSRVGSDMMDLGSAAMSLLWDFEPLAARHCVTLEQAIQPGLAVQINSRLLHDILGEVLKVAIERSPAGRVLLTAAMVAGRVQITVSDDGQETDRDLRASWLRQAEGVAALQGATMQIDVRPGQGTTVVLRLPAAAAPAGGEPVHGPVPEMIWETARRAPQNSGANH